MGLKTGKPIGNQIVKWENLSLCRGLHIEYGTGKSKFEFSHSLLSK